MSLKKGQRLKLLKLWEILQQETDKDHTLSTSELLLRLKNIGIVCDRRTLYADIKALNENGYEIKCVRRIANEYYVEKREFSLAEIQILMNAVQAASFISEDKTSLLVDKISELAGSRRAEVIKQNIVAFNTLKSSNEEIFMIVSIITNAINKARKIEFLYFDYDLNGRRVFRKENKVYKVNPIATIFSNDKYYLLCYDDKYGNLSHYRIDRMAKVHLSNEQITPSELNNPSVIREHKKQLFGMYKGEECNVTFEADNSLIDAVLDKFGFETHLFPNTETTFRFSSIVQISPVFFGWCCSFGNKLKIVAPNNIVETMKKHLNILSALYDKSLK